MTKPAEILTFYSHKGGVGRSQALANVGVTLANRGHSVLLVDMDLEAPGLHHFFHAPTADGRGAGDRLRDRDLGEGVLDWFTAAATLPEAEPPFPAPRPLAHPLLMRGNIYLLPAGRMDEGYAQRLSALSWAALYRDAEGFALVERFREHLLGFGAEFVLIDARTGLTDISNVATFQLPDRVVLLFTLHWQGIEGTARMARALQQAREDGWLGGRLRSTYLLASRVSEGESEERRRDWENRAAGELHGLGTVWVEHGQRIPHDGDAAFGENIVVNPLGSTGQLSQAYLALADRLFGEPAAAPGVDARERALDLADALAREMTTALGGLEGVLKEENPRMSDLEGWTRRAAPSGLGGAQRRWASALLEATGREIPLDGRPATLSEWQRAVEAVRRRTASAVDEHKQELLEGARRELAEAAGSMTPVDAALARLSTLARAGSWLAFREGVRAEAQRLLERPEDLLARGRLTAQELSAWLPEPRDRQRWLDERLRVELEGDMRVDGLANALALREFGPDEIPTPSHWVAYDWLLEAGWEPASRFERVGRPLWVAEWRMRLRDGMGSAAPRAPWNEFSESKAHVRAVGAVLGEHALLVAIEDAPVAQALLGDADTAEILAAWVPGLVSRLDPSRRLEVLARCGLSTAADASPWWLLPLLDAALAAELPRAALEVWAAEGAIRGASPELPDTLGRAAAAAIASVERGAWLAHPDFVLQVWALPSGRRALATLLCGDESSTSDARVAIEEAGLPPRSAALGRAWAKFCTHTGPEGVDRLRELRRIQFEWAGTTGGWEPEVESFQTTWAPALHYQAEFRRYWHDQARQCLASTATRAHELDRLEDLAYGDWFRDALRKRDATRVGGSDPFPDVERRMETAFGERRRALVGLARVREGGRSLLELIELGEGLRVAAADLGDADVAAPSSAGWTAAYRPTVGELDPWLVRTRDAAGFLGDILAMWSGVRSVSVAFEDALGAQDLRCAAELVRGDAGRGNRLLEQWERALAALEEALLPLRQGLQDLGSEASHDVRATAVETIAEAGAHIARLRVEDAASLLGLLRLHADELRQAAEAVELAELALSEAEDDHRRRADAQRALLRAVKNEADRLLDEALFQVDRRRLEQVRYAHARVLDAVGGLDLPAARLAGAQLQDVVDGRLTLEPPRPSSVAAPATASNATTAAPARTPRGPRPAPGRLADLVQQELEAALAPGQGTAALPTPPVWTLWSRSVLKQFHEGLAASAHHAPGPERLDWLVATGRLHLLAGDFERAALVWRDALKLAVALDTDAGRLEHIVAAIAVSATLPALPADERDAASSARNLERLCHPSRRALVAERVDRLEVWELIADAAVFAGAAGAAEFYDRWITAALAEHPVAREPLARRAAASVPAPEAEAGCVALLSCLFPSMSAKLRSSDRSATFFRPLAPSVEQTIEALRAGLRAISDDPAADAAAEALPAAGAPLPTLLGAPLSLHPLTTEIVATEGARAVLRITTTARSLPLRGLQVEVTYSQGDRRLAKTFSRPAAVPFVRAGGWAEVVLPLAHFPEEELDGTLEARLSQRAPGGQLVDLKTTHQKHKLRILPPPEPAPRLNPYAAGRPIPKEGHLFGRAEEIESVVQRLLGTFDTNVVLVQGERRMGKTSLLTAACQHPRIRDTFSQIVWLDLQGVADKETPAAFWRYRFIEPLIRRLEAEGLAAPSINEDALRESPGRAAADFARAVDRELVRKRRKPFLLVVDELERLLVVIDGRQGLGEDTLASLREIIQANRHLAFLMAGVSDVLSRHTRTSTHRLYGLALDVPLGPLHAAAASELAERPVLGNYTLVPAARDLLLAETGRHPYLLQFVLHRLFTLATKNALRTITVTDLEELLEQQVVKQPIAFANYLEALPDPADLQLLHAVAAVQRGERSVLAREVADKLQRWGQTADEATTRTRLEDVARRAPAVLSRLLNGRFRVPVGLFARYLREQRRGGSSLVVAD